MDICEKFGVIDTSKYNVIDVVRTLFKDNSTLGKLFINDVFFCYTLEPFYYDLSKYIGQPNYESIIKNTKAIELRFRHRYLCVPNGVYDLRLDIQSSKYNNKRVFRDFNKGFMPRLVGVPAYSGVLIHTGNYVRHTTGCILLGSSYNFNIPAVYNSLDTFKKFYTKIKAFKYPIKIRISCV